jgi:hypothetical protein
MLLKETVLKNKFDVFNISETWLNNSVTNLELEIPGYEIFRVDRSNKDGSGVCVYVSNT